MSSAGSLLLGLAQALALLALPLLALRLRSLLVTRFAGLNYDDVPGAGVPAAVAGGAFALALFIARGHPEWFRPEALFGPDAGVWNIDLGTLLLERLNPLAYLSIDPSPPPVEGLVGRVVVPILVDAAALAAGLSLLAIAVFWPWRKWLAALIVSAATALITGTLVIYGAASSLWLLYQLNFWVFVIGFFALRYRKRRHR